MLEAHFGEQSRFLQNQIAANQQSSAAVPPAEEQRRLAAQLLQRVENSARQRVLADVSNTYNRLLAETTRIGDAQLAQQKQFAEEQLKIQREAAGSLDRSAAAVEALLREFKQHSST